MGNRGCLAVFPLSKASSRGCVAAPSGWIAVQHFDAQIQPNPSLVSLLSLAVSSHHVTAACGSTAVERAPTCRDGCHLVMRLRLLHVLRGLRAKYSTLMVASSEWRKCTAHVMMILSATLYIVSFCCSIIDDLEGRQIRTGCISIAHCPCRWNRVTAGMYCPMYGGGLARVSGLDLPNCQYYYRKLYEGLEGAYERVALVLLLHQYNK